MPTYVNDLADACLVASQKKSVGIFNISSNKLMSIYEIALQIAKTFNLDQSLIKPITASQLNQTANRPKKTGFIIDKAVKELQLINQSFSERLAVFKTTHPNL